MSVSSGIYDTQNCSWEPISFPQGWRSYLAETVKQNVPTPVIGVSVIREAQYAEALLERGAVDFVGVARGTAGRPGVGCEGRNRAGGGNPPVHLLSCIVWRACIPGGMRSVGATSTPVLTTSMIFGTITAPGKGTASGGDRAEAPQERRRLESWPCVALSPSCSEKRDQSGGAAAFGSEAPR